MRHVAAYDVSARMEIGECSPGSLRIIENCVMTACVLIAILLMNE